MVLCLSDKQRDMDKLVRNKISRVTCRALTEMEKTKRKGCGESTVKVRCEGQGNIHFSELECIL